MATIAQIKSAVDTWVTANTAKLTAVQDAYYAANGRYWQGIATPSTVPDNGATPDGDYTKKPTDQLERWSDVFKGGNALPQKLPAQVQIDVYDGPLGKGWSGTFRCTKDGSLYFKTWNFGPETWRAVAWTTVTPWPPVLP